LGCYTKGTRVKQVPIINATRTYNAALGRVVQVDSNKTRVESACGFSA
jgi:hypothetical protein